MPKVDEAAAFEATAKKTRYNEHVAALHWYAIWLTGDVTPARWAGHRNSGCSDRLAPVTAPSRIQSSTVVGIQISLASWLSADTTLPPISAAVSPHIWLPTSDGLS